MDRSDIGIWIVVCCFWSDSFVFDMQLRLHEFIKWSVYCFSLYLHKQRNTTFGMSLCRAHIRRCIRSHMQCRFRGGTQQLQLQLIRGRECMQESRSSIRCSCTWIHVNIDSDDGNGENIQLIISCMRLITFVNRSRCMWCGQINQRQFHISSNLMVPTRARNLLLVLCARTIFLLFFPISFSSMLIHVE